MRFIVILRALGTRPMEWRERFADLEDRSKQQETESPVRGKGGSEALGESLRVKLVWGVDWRRVEISVSVKRNAVKSVDEDIRVR